MVGLLERFAANLGWTVCSCNAIVEGTSDVTLFWLAATLHFEKHKQSILGDRLAILPAGRGKDGGVDGVNRKLNAARQIADVDRGPDAGLRHRFIGLYDNDHAGRLAVKNACEFDRRLIRCADVFLLHPIMPLASGADHAVLKRRFETENAPFKGLDWEIEDCLSDRLISAFRQADSTAVVSEHELGGRTHYEFSTHGKGRLHEYAKTHAKFEDALEILKIIRALHDYFNLPITHIVCECP